MRCCSLLTYVPTLVLAALSWHFIEAPKPGRPDPQRAAENVPGAFPSQATISE